MKQKNIHLYSFIFIILTLLPGLGYSGQVTFSAANPNSSSANSNNPISNTPNFSANTFKSSEQASTIIELYTSEGCSSCPPADNWLTQFTQHPKLFTEIIPLAFHVDYWDYLGWQDPFAQKAFAKRQRRLRHDGKLNSVYTPAFVVNSKEWRAWFRNTKAMPSPPKKTVGVLQARIESNTLLANFNGQQEVELELAFIGMGLRTQVKAGENKHKTLEHNFVVLDFKTIPARYKTKDDDLQQWHWPLPLSSRLTSTEQAVSAVILLAKSPTTGDYIQATGSFLTIQR